MEGVLQTVLQVVMGLLGLSFLVFIHEMGHFLVAKWSGVRVEVFSIGFGKKLIKFKYGETTYCISAIPFGGYVAMSGEQLHSSEPIEPQEANESDGSTQAVQSKEDSDEVFTPSSTGYNAGDFASKPIWVRAAIAFGGPFVNIVFAFFALFCLYLYGVPEYSKEKLIVGSVVQDLPGAQAGVLPKDTIILIDGKKTLGWNEYMEDMAMSKGEPRVHTILRGQDTLEITVTPIIPPQLEDWGVAFTGISSSSKVIVHNWLESSPAQGTNMELGDQILTINGSPIVSTADLSTWVSKSEGKELAIEVLHKDQTIDTVNIAPQFFKAGTVANVNQDRWLIGISLAEQPLDPPTIVSYGPVDAMSKAWDKGIFMAEKPFKYLWRMITGKIPAKSMSGPVAIVGMIGHTFNEGLVKAILFLALISMNLGIMNLLPLAVTDGGILMFLTLEAIRGKPLNPRLQLKINTVAMYFFIGFFVFVMYHDVLRIPVLFGK